MAKRRDAHEVSELDPMFYIPEGLDSLSYGDGLIVDYPDEVFDEDILYDEDGAEDEEYLLDDDAETFDEVDTPNYLTVVKQTIRLQPNGTHVVDLVLDVEDVPGALHYEFRAVKV